jgi:uncharacterized protein (DUF885 family)
MYPSEPFPRFVDDLLAYLYEVSPGDASLDGVHLHDDVLEDFSRAALDNHLRALSGFGRRLHQINAAILPPVEQVEHPMVAASIEARMFELEQVRGWERNPQIYAQTLATSLASQLVFAYAPEADRARRVLSKLRQVPRFVQAARDNVKEPAGIFVKVALETWRATLQLIEHDLPRAFSALDDLHILGDLADASAEATTVISSYAAFLETDLAPRAKASFRLGRDHFEQKLKLEEGITLSVERLLQVAHHELTVTQEEFRAVAERVNSRDPDGVWREAKLQHPRAGELVKTAREQVAELAEFVQRHNIVTVPASEPVVVARSPAFSRCASTSLWAAGPFESKPSRAYYYVTDADPSWSAERQEEYLRDFNYSSLWNVTMHEVYPGHFLHAQHLRRVESKVRKSTFFSPASFVEGWAHYAEQMMVDAGFHRSEPTIRLGQLAESLVRLARFIVAIRLHCEDLSVEQGVRFFRDEAFLEETTARREAERGTFDPTYLVSSVGKLMLLKLRHDYEAEQGGRFSLRAFHDALLGQGTAPFWALRRLLLKDTPESVLD